MNDHEQRWRVAGLCWLCATAVTALAACGGGGGHPPAAAAPPQSASVTQTISAAAGGTIDGPAGVTLTIPPDALAADTAITIAINDSGAPPLPDVLAPLAEPMIALLPHGTTFSVPVILSVPELAAPAGLIYKTNAQRDGWEPLVAVPSGGRVETAITGFSHIARVSCIGPPFTNPACNCPSPSQLPRIIAEPRDSPTLGEGGFWIFRVDLVACAPYAFRWLRNGLFLANETNQDILINPLAYADNGARYSVMVTDAAGRSVSSRAALLTVNAAPPAIVNQPADLQVVVGASAVFTAASTSSTAQTLQWKRCDAVAVCPASVSAWPDVLGQTSAQLTLPGVALPDSGARVALCATNVASMVCSNSATLTVLPAPVQPVIVTAPQALSVAAGTSANFTVLASGGSLSYEWQGSRDGVTFAPEARCANSATCTLSNTALADDGLLLRVRAFNGVGQAISAPPALLTVRLVAGVALMRVGAGDLFSLGLKGNGRMFAWGANAAGQLGDGPLNVQTAPVQVSTLDQVATFAIGPRHALALRSDGSVWAWGDGGGGRLGSGDGANRPTPFAVAGLPVSRGVAAGEAHSLAVGADSSVWGWGVNGCGQVGDGTASVRLLAARAAAFSGAVSATAGLQHSLAVHSNGSVWAWGCNSSGQLGNGTRTARLVPTPIGGIAQAVAVAAGRVHSLALTADGSVYAWGLNSSGQLGDGTASDSNSPRRVALPGVVIAIAAGRNHSLALLADGRVFAWGENTFGQIGNGTSLDVLAPVQVGAPLPAAIVAIGAGVGAQHSLALDAAGVVWGWGRNDARQLADGTLLIRERPVQAIGLNLN